MTAQIDPETFAHLVDLASFEFEPDQAEYLIRQMNAQLKAINELAAIPLDEDMPISLRGIPYPQERCPQLRSDDWKPYENREELVKQMPQFEDGYVIVPDIPHTTLE